MTVGEHRMQEIISHTLPKIAKSLEQIANHLSGNITCCICGKPILGKPNNAYPLGNINGEVCCDKCNIEKVLPERVRLMKGER